MAPSSGQQEDNKKAASHLPHLGDSYLEGPWSDGTQLPQHHSTVLTTAGGRLLHGQEGFVPVGHSALIAHYVQKQEK